jgi:hypothetical protein
MWGTDIADSESDDTGKRLFSGFVLKRQTAAVAANLCGELHSLVALGSSICNTWLLGILSTLQVKEYPFSYSA